MNVTYKLSFMKDDKKVLGAGGYFLDRDDGGNMCYSGIWQDGKVIALVLDECCDSDVVRERGEMFVKAVNAHDKLVEALRAVTKLANKNICSHDEMHRGGAIWDICSMCGAKWADDEGGRPEFKWPVEIEMAHAALAAAGEQV